MCRLDKKVFGNKASDEKLKLVREKMGLSQVAFAKEFGVAFVTINRWENEHYMPNYKYVKKLEQFCKEQGVDL